MTTAKIRILIVEDDFFVSEEIKRAIKGLDFEIVGEAANGREAVDLTDQLHPDVVLMDLRMPQMDGLEASRLIQGQNPTPIVILTAYESEELLKESVEAGIGAYLTKPPQASEIARAVTVAMARHKDLMELRRLNEELQKALAEIRTLQGILPICSYCKRIRADDGRWVEVDSYIRSHTDADISHGICAQCLKKHYPEYYGKIIKD